MKEILSTAVENKLIAITGGYGHLGRAICESLAAHGARVIVLARNEDKFEAAFGDNRHDHIGYLKADIADVSSMSSAFGIIKDQWGPIDCLINNAFYLRGQSPEEMSETDFTFGLEGCLTSVYAAIKEVIPYLNKEASIVNVSSMYGMVAPDFKVYEDFPGFLNPPHYGAAKAGVLQLTKYYASYLGNKGIRVNSVSPGAFPSEPVQQSQKFIDLLAERTILGRIGLPEELAGIFVFLASDAARYITGQNFTVDGGWTVR